MKAEERWQTRFRSPRMTLPTWARQAPHHAVYRSNASGTWEIYAWDRATGTSRQVTDRPNGTAYGDIDPTGQWIWWFADTDGDEYGVWIRQHFHGGAARPLDISPGHPAGLALAANGTAAIGRSCRLGFQIVLMGDDGEPTVLYQHKESASVAGISLDGSLIAIDHSEHGDARHPGLRVVKKNGSVVGDLYDGPGKGVRGIRFSPVLGDRRLLVLHERRGRHEPLVWDPLTGEQREIYLRDPGEVTADWYDDGRALLIVNHHRGRTQLFRYDLVGGAMTPIETPHGVIESAATRPDGTVEYSWSSAAHAPVIRSSHGHVVMSPGPTAPPSVPVEDVDVEGPGGWIHAMISRPTGQAAPYPTVFLLHGGPSAQDNDSFLPHVAAWVDSGFAVVRVNYRGSIGYGSAWRDALHGEVGHIELADVSAVRDWVVNRNIADPDRLILAGGSWGGYLTLLGLGTQPKVWSAGIAAVPIADHRAAYEDESEALRSFHRALFGGSPEEVPERYAASSPITYADMVEAPLLILAGENDPRCPIRQIESFIEAVPGPCQVYRYDAGHASLVVEERIRQMRTQIEFATRVMDGRKQPATPGL
ncbi:S9 family peptidase [Herbidospora yilanensis]|uniref:S9 family peptidase n=1 Tax=Herbidospora yilanensis TaxID=354426 RepID=UPI00078404C4|nr:prolyl oligopeptidase family serine peptidase [Herbidospora yilanensis]